MLTPTGTWCEDSWLVTAALLRETKRLKFLVAFRPNSISPTLAAQKAATYQRISGGRLLLNIVTGGDDTEQRRFGDWLDHDERYDRTDEFLVGAARRAERRAVRLRGPLLPRRRGDRQPGARADAAALLRWCVRRGRGRRRQARRRLPRVGRAAGDGRAPSRPHARARRRARARRCASASGCTSSAATGPRTRGPRPSASSTPSTRPSSTASQAALARSASVGQQRMVSLHGGSRDDLVDRAEPVGRYRSRTRRRRHRARRQPRGGRRPHRGVPRRSASTSSSSPATPTSRRRTGSARA